VDTVDMVVLAADLVADTAVFASTVITVIDIEDSEEDADGDAEEDHTILVSLSVEPKPVQ